MTTVVTVENQPTGSATDVAVDFLDKTDLKLKSQTSSANGLINTATFVLADGSELVETKVIVKTDADVINNVLRCSIRLITDQVVTVDGEEAERAPIEAVIAWNTPGRWEDSAKVIKFIGTAYSLVMNGVTTKVPNTGILSTMNRGLLSQIFS
jgi:hypothetical protein